MTLENVFIFFCDRYAFVDRCLSFCLLAIALSVFLRFTDSDNPFGIFSVVDIYICNYIQFFISHTILDTQIHIMIQRLYLSFVLLLVL
jgi:hypothetical protein